MSVEEVATRTIGTKVVEGLTSFVISWKRGAKLSIFVDSNVLFYVGQDHSTPNYLGCAISLCMTNLSPPHGDALVEHLHAEVVPLSAEDGHHTDGFDMVCLRQLSHLGDVEDFLRRGAAWERRDEGASLPHGAGLPYQAFLVQPERNSLRTFEFRCPISPVALSKKLAGRFRLTVSSLVSFPESSVRGRADLAAIDVDTDFSLIRNVSIYRRATSDGILLWPHLVSLEERVFLQ